MLYCLEKNLPINSLCSPRDEQGEHISHLKLAANAATAAAIGAFASASATVIINDQ
jgi:hypothetical protein